MLYAGGNCHAHCRTMSLSITESYTPRYNYLPTGLCLSHKSVSP